MYVIPKPFKEERGQGFFVFDSSVKISAELPIISSMLNAFCKADVPKGDKTVEFVRGETEYDYELAVTEKSVTATAATDEGLFHAAVTLIQLIICADGADARIPVCKISDKPRFAYRGLMIDVCRHFFGVETVKKMIDVMSVFKFNYLHMHLSDDQGFRLQIDAMPKLHGHASKRAQTCGDRKPHGGYYTKAQIAELVKYAAERFVRIIPEIDLPGHTRAIVSAYPELSCSGKQTDVATWFGIHSKVLCVGKDTTYDALEKIIGETADMFPCAYFHLGGDEVPKLEWEKCPDCGKVMEENGLDDYEKLQGYFTNRVIKMLSERGKTPILWNEALFSDMLDKNAVVQYWEGGKATAARVAQSVRDENRKVVVSCVRPYYLDYPYGFSSLKSAYMFEPCLESFGEQGAKGVLGVECPIWTEHVATEEKLFTQVFPRAIAVAESGWSQGKKDYADFEDRLLKVVKLLRSAGISYKPVGKCNPNPITGAMQMIAFGIKAASKLDRDSARSARSAQQHKKKK